MRSTQWQLGILGTISAFAYRHRETKNELYALLTQDIPCILWNPKFLLSIHSSSPFAPILSQIKLLHAPILLLEVPFKYYPAV